MAEKTPGQIAYEWVWRFVFASWVNLSADDQREWNHAVEKASAPLLARIAELEAEIASMQQKRCKGCGRELLQGYCELCEVWQQ